ncbi:2-amino-4-hydroxy-6-hydroxymethyldihydropteridine diphosphokinase [Parabacteroides pacaensis]|uniref:2-amino-4-hydroxy-6- hydroxymethyldihydropteridine diphosphokinase n=1 Tax=Parabacteroides pacaensis TaxID=2086575 RepID=UPI000D0FAD30|nr:2-amino-4-hydroxy-6-hydroxymethyldihydropteridine diphosphokinase [Parabacteroides pacaensis]
MNIGILGLGSNYRKEENMELARKMLEDSFHSIRFSKPVYTKPHHCKNPELFLNQVGWLETDLSKEEVTSILKHIETLLGRTPQDKLKEQIPIDIDLIQWNKEIIKEQDISRDYIIQGLHFLQQQSL